MTEQTTDGQPKGEEVVEAPPVPQTPAGSEVEGSGEVSLDAGALEQISTHVVDQLRPVLDDLVDSRYKSGTDTRLAREGKLLTTFAEYLKKFDGDVEKAERELKIDAMLEDSEGAGGTATREVPQVQEKSLEDRTAELLSELREEGVTITNDELNRSLTTRPATEWTPDAYLEAISRVAIKKAKQGNVSEGSLVGGSSSPVGEPEQKLAELYARLDETQLNPSGHEEERAAIFKEIERLGSA